MTHEGAPKYQQSRMGVSSLWAFTRVSQIFWLILFAKDIYDSHKLDSFFEIFYFDVVLFGVFTFLLHPFSDGWADANGIHYRRYIRWKILRWETVRAITWRGIDLHVAVNDKGYLTGTLVFWTSPLEALAETRVKQSGGTPTPPEVLMHISALLLESPPKLILGPLRYPGIHLSLLVGNAAAILIAVIGLLWKLGHHF